jgi:CelD/BcsL family acetyltransferase involved in cellulose biosynthesis
LVRIDVLRTPAELESLRAAWDALADACFGTTPFQRPAWALAWTRHMQIETPRALAVHEGRDLVGLLPAFVSGSTPRRAMSLLGAGISDHLDALAAPGFEPVVIDAMRGWLARSRAEWDKCVFDELGPRALLRELCAPAGMRATIEPQSVCPVLRIPDEQAILEGAVPRHHCAKLREAHRRAERTGALVHARGDREEFPDALRTLFALDAKRWELRHEAGVLGDPRVRRLHEEVAAAFASRGTLRFYLVRMGGVAAAVIYAFREQRRLHMVLQGIEPALERLSPGLLAVGYAIEDALAEGVREFDFLRGAEPHKYAWGAMDEANARVWIAADAG